MRKFFFPGQKINNEQVTQTLLGFDQNSFFNGVEETTSVWNALDELGGVDRGQDNTVQAPPLPEDFSRFLIAPTVSI